MCLRVFESTEALLHRCNGRQLLTPFDIDCYGLVGRELCCGVGRSACFRVERWLLVKAAMDLVCACYV